MRKHAKKLLTGHRKAGNRDAKKVVVMQERSYKRKVSRKGLKEERAS